MDIGDIFNRPQAPPSVNDAIQGAATKTGASFDYLLAAAQAESGLNPQAASPTSSALGLYQFIDQTWLATLKRAGPSLGYGKYADAIVQNASGRFDVPDAAMRRDVMALRYDPAANAAMAGALTRDNAAALAAGLGRKPSDGELYIAHVLGSAGAVKLTGLAVTNPGTPAAALFPAAAEANRSVFYNQKGGARSVLDVYGELVGRYDGARTTSGAASAASSTSPAASATSLGATIAAAFNLTPNPTARSTAAAPATKVAPATATMPVAPAAGVPLVIVPGVPTTNPARAPDAAVATAAYAAADASGQAAAPVFNGLFSDRGEPVSQGVQNTATPRAPLSPARPASPASAASLVAASGTRELFQPTSSDPAGLFGR
jgi:hypothetical protein